MFRWLTQIVISAMLSSSSGLVELKITAFCNLDTSYDILFQGQKYKIWFWACILQLTMVRKFEGTEHDMFNK